MAIIDAPNGSKEKRNAVAVLSYRTIIGGMLALIVWLANQIWDEAKEIKSDVKGYALQLTDHSTRIDRAEQDIRDESMRLYKLDSRVSTIEGRTR